MQEIICKDAFANTIRRIDALTDSEYLAVQTIWIAAEQAMQGKSVQQASLTSSKVNIYFDGFENPEVIAKQEFTREELQHMKSRFQDVLSKAELIKQDYKEAIQKMWVIADKNSHVGKAAFEELNFLREDQRRFKRDMNKLSSIQAKIKRQLSK